MGDTSNIPEIDFDEAERFVRGVREVVVDCFDRSISLIEAPELTGKVRPWRERLQKLLEKLEELDPQDFDSNSLDWADRVSREVVRVNGVDIETLYEMILEVSDGVRESLVLADWGY